MGGGGGGDPGAAARQMEAERQARIQAATEEINRIFNNEVKMTGTRYVHMNPGMDFGNGLHTPSSPSGRYMSEEQFAEMQAKTREKMAALRGKNNGFGGGIVDGLSGLIGGLSSMAWRPEKYTYWVPGDPANNRQVMYDAQRSSVYDLNRMDVDRQAAEAERANRFGLARAGLLGGSANVDSLGDMDRRTNEGLMRAGGIADQASADLFSADERTRANLISLAQSGIDTGTAAQQALNGLEVNAANAAGARAGATVGDLFGSMSQAYLMNQMRAGQQAGMNPNHGQQWLGVSDTRKGYGGSTS